MMMRERDGRVCKEESQTCSQAERRTASRERLMLKVATSTGYAGTKSQSKAAALTAAQSAYMRLLASVSGESALLALPVLLGSASGGPGQKRERKTTTAWRAMARAAVLRER